ncbi:AAA family ATPase [Dietzia sp. 179-F 9C3 NHS]|uniref:AAA family ATPase n=1 Tax=Dietzia sp. 179-F 9C3 NHS TaxID=3374295 RepID=UPI0038799CA2
MRITHLHGFNFRSLDDMAIDLTDDGLIAMVGAPGSGKSSLLSLVPFVLYGDTGQNGSLPDLRRRGSDESDRCGGAVTLIHNGDRIEASRWLTRTRPKGKIKETGHASLTINGETVDGMTPTRLTAEMTRILGQPKDSFRGANFIGQGEVDTLATATPTEVQALVEHHTGLAPLTRARQKAREAAREAATTAKALPGDAEELQRAEANLDEAQEETQECARLAETATTKRDHARSLLADASATVDRLRRATETARDSLDKVVAARAVAESARQRADEAAQAAREQCPNGTDTGDLDEQIAALEERMQLLVGVGVSYRDAQGAAARAHSRLQTAQQSVQQVDRDALAREIDEAASARDRAADAERSALNAQAAANAEGERLAKAVQQLRSAETGSACCPTCRQNVADLDALISQFDEEAAAVQARADKAVADRRTAVAAHQQASRRISDIEATLREADTADRDAQRARQDADAAEGTATARAADMRAAVTALDGTADDDLAGEPLLNAGLAAHAAAKTKVGQLRQLRQVLVAASETRAAADHATGQVQVAQEQVVDAPDPAEVAEAVAEQQRLQSDYDEAVDKAARADKVLGSAQVALMQMQTWVEGERAKWDAKREALDAAEVAAGTAEAIGALRSELLAEYTGQISAAATELLARFGGEHVAFHLDSDFVPRVELLDGTLVETKTLSGGEKARAGLAFRLGITLQITRGGVPDQVLGDEVTNYLDEEGRRAVISALGQLFPSVVLISHTSEALDFAARTIALDRDPLGATMLQGEPRPQEPLAEAG